MGKRVSPSFKSHKRRCVLPEDYIVVKDVHETIVSPADFELVQRLNAVDNGNPQGLKLVAAMADKPAQRISLREKLEAFKVRAAGAGKPEIGKAKGKEETL